VDEVRMDSSWAGRDYDSDASYRASLQAFVRELWERKDARIASMLPAGAE
jgi:hypothetical protein